MISLAAEIVSAADFVRPLTGLDNALLSDPSILTLLNSHTPNPCVHELEGRSKPYLLESLRHLEAIHLAAVREGFSPESEYDSTLMSILYALIDLIATQWVLPCLSPNVVFPHRPKSTLSAVQTNEKHDKVWCLKTICETVDRLGTDPNGGISPIISQRFLPDLVSALAELAFAPRIADTEDQALWQRRFATLLVKTPTSRLLPLLTSYVSQDLPIWMRPHITESLSLLPLRSRGIRHIVEYISMSHQPNGGDQRQALSSRLPITLSIMQQATKLIAAPPASMRMEEWIEKIAPQLWNMLDGNEGSDMARAAGHIISSGFLSKRSTGAPGKPGWNTFAIPLIAAINPKQDYSSLKNSEDAFTVVVPSGKVLQALERMATIISSHPNTGVTPRLVRPVKLGLWGLLHCVKAPKEKVIVPERWSVVLESILKRYFELESEVHQIDEIARNLLWDGSSQWTFSTGADGGVDIRLRPLVGQYMESALANLESIDKRTQTFVKLLPTSQINYDVITSAFCEILRRWLTPATLKSANKTLGQDSHSDAFGMLINAKLSQAILEKLQKRLIKDPGRLMALFDQIMQEFVTLDQQRQSNIFSLKDPTIKSLGRIVETKREQGQNSLSSMESDFEDLAITGISILSLFLTSSMPRNDVTDKVLRGIAASLRYICSRNERFSTNLVDPATAALDIINLWIGTSEEKVNWEKADRVSRPAWDAIIGDLAAQEAPIRASAIAQIDGLIDDHCSVKLDVPQTAHLLVQVIRMESDSYVYLPAIRALTKLCKEHSRPHFVCRITLDAFLDVEEKNNGGIDGRLRIGEAIDSLGKYALVKGQTSHDSRSTAAAAIAEVCLKLASRRGHRPLTRAAREAAAVKKATRIKREHEDGFKAWGGGFPEIDMKLIDPNHEPETTQQAKEREYLESIVQGWEDTGLEEDVRVRTSALSILCTLFESHVHIIELRDGMVHAIDIALSISVFELQPDRIILRRAAVMVVMSILRGIDSLLQGNDTTVVDHLLHKGSRKWSDMQQIMRWLASEDRDETVRGHAEAVIDGLETLTVKMAVGREAVHHEIEMDNGLSAGLRGIQFETGELTGGVSLVEEME